MTAFEFKLAADIARDYSLNLSKENDDVLFGFGLPDFKPVQVSLKTVARVIRWQCSVLDGTWDWTQFNEDKPFLMKQVEIIDLTVPELTTFIVKHCTQRLRGLQAAA